jgi:hypothetical protein
MGTTFESKDTVTRQLPIFDVGRGPFRRYWWAVVAGWSAAMAPAAVGVFARPTLASSAGSRLVALLALASLRCIHTRVRVATDGFTIHGWREDFISYQSVVGIVASGREVTISMADRPAVRLSLDAVGRVWMYVSNIAPEDHARDLAWLMNYFRRRHASATHRASAHRASGA